MLLHWLVWWLTTCLLGSLRHRLDYVCDSAQYYRFPIYRGYIWYNNAHSTTITMKKTCQICTHKRHPIPRHLYGRAMGCLLWVIPRKMAAIYRKLIVPKYIQYLSGRAVQWVRFDVKYPVDVDFTPPVMQSTISISNKGSLMSWGIQNGKKINRVIKGKYCYEQWHSNSLT